MTDFAQFYIQQPEPNRSCLMAMRDLLFQFDSELSETRKYGMPCFQKNGKAFCYLWIDKKTTHPYFLLVHSDKFNHTMLIKGSRKKMKILPLNPAQDIPTKEVHKILALAMTHHPK